MIQFQKISQTDVKEEGRTDPISYLESKGMCAIFRVRAKAGKKIFKKGKIFENLGKNLQYLKIF